MPRWKESPLSKAARPGDVCSEKDTNEPRLRLKTFPGWTGPSTAPFGYRNAVEERRVPVQTLPALTQEANPSSSPEPEVWIMDSRGHHVASKVLTSQTRHKVAGKESTGNSWMQPDMSPESKGQ